MQCMYFRGVSGFLKVRGASGNTSSNAAPPPAAPSILPKSGGAIATPATPLLTPLKKVLEILETNKRAACLFGTLEYFIRKP